MLRLHPRQLLRRPFPLCRQRNHSLPTTRRYATSFADFKPPPIRQRLKPLIPFFIYWTIITSLAVHLLRARIHSKEELDKRKAQITVLSDLVERLRIGKRDGRGKGKRIEDDEIQRELEMVGLRQRTILTEGVEDVLEDTANVGWIEVLFGKKRIKNDVNNEKELESLEEWVQVVNEATQSTTSPPTTSSSTPKIPERSGQVKRAPSSNVYM
ncbi:uncharacterized protein IL334_003283 [Kwoniella shivajii]|uniref:Uncharacterized protein n=1 Tax=Kwoniella shivajii TaxID=564305 RepID=A0ABZ1CXN9_9TREE|nr:hypothetical protein IL334_003283 [Kwoniella shivajii]